MSRNAHGEPRDLVDRLEASPQLPAGSEERFNGYGLMGLPLASGHILAMRRFPASSVGPGYTSVWHRGPERLTGQPGGFDEPGLEEDPC
jgi:hypothetical protein